MGMSSRQSLMLIAFLSLLSVTSSSVGLFVALNQQQRIRSLEAKVDQMESVKQSESTVIESQADPVLKMEKTIRQLSDSAAQFDQLLNRLQLHETNLEKQIAGSQGTGSVNPTPPADP
jgi:TolA-binding protein